MLAVQRGPAPVVLAVVLVAALLTALVGGAGLGPGGLAVGAAAGAGLAFGLGRGLVRLGSPGLGPADLVTLVRAAMSCGVAGLVADSLAGTSHPATLTVALAGGALALDAVDGQVARRSGAVSAFGARFDGETDAFLIAVLSVEVARTSGPLVLALGAARYAFLAAGFRRPWMRAPLPPRYWRKVVAATVGVSLLAVASGALPPAVAAALLATAGILLAESFGRDVLWLWRRRPRPAAATRPSAARVPGLPVQPPPAAPGAEVRVGARRARAGRDEPAPVGQHPG